MRSPSRLSTGGDVAACVPPHPPRVNRARASAGAAIAAVVGTPYASPMAIDRQFTATCYAALLGREPETDAVCAVPEDWPLETVVGNYIRSSEFQEVVIDPLMAARMPDIGRFSTPLARYHRFWAADRLPLAEPTRAEIATAADWWDFLRLLLADPVFMALADRAPMIAPPLPSWVMEDRFERLARQRRP